jgi:outer membrane protein assembly factor BamB
MPKIFQAILYAVSLYILISISLPVASAQTVVNVLPATSSAWGLEYHDGYLWAGDDGDGYIRKIDPANGAVLETLPTPYDENHISYGANHGVAWDGSGFWVAGDYGKDWLYKIGPTGAFLDTLTTPADAIGGLSWDGTYLLVSRYYPNNLADVLQIDTSDGTIVGAPIPTQGQQPFGIAYDNADQTIWNGQDDNDGDPEWIWHLNYPDGSVIDHFDAPAGSPKGIALGGGYMWVVANTIGGAGRKIYQIDLAGGGTGDIAAQPTAYDFNIISFGTPASYQQTLRNAGDGPLTITNIYTTGPFDLDAVSLPLTLGPLEYISFSVRFDPPAVGDYSGALVVVSDDFDEETLYVSLAGEAVDPDPTVFVTPGQLNFGDTGVAMVKGLAISIMNTGFEDLVVSSIASDHSSFEVSDLALPVVLGTYETLGFSVTFVPDAAVAYNGELAVTTNDPDLMTLTVDLNGRGVWKTWEPGEVIWWAQGIENVVCVQPIPDLGTDGISEVVMETYDAGASGDPFVAYRGNSDGMGVEIWAQGAGGSGGYGDLCLSLTDDLDDDGFAEILRGTAWGGRTIEVRGSEDGELIWSYDTSANDGGGWVYSVAPIADLTGDGKPEVLAGAGTNGDPYSGARRIYCLDGSDGSFIFVYAAAEAFNCVKAMGDVNGDEIPDVIGGNADGYVYCVSGASVGAGSLIWSFDTGGNAAYVDEIEDVTGDGIPDVIAGSWSGFVTCINGATGGQFWSAPIGNWILETRVIEDVSGDGVADVAVCNVGSNFRVLSGADGTLHWYVSTGANVWSIYPIPDVDGDGIIDIVAGAQNDLVYCVSGASDDTIGDVIWTTNVGALVFSVRAIEDVNGNGTPDVIAGTQYLSAGGGRLFCLDGGRPAAAVDPDPITSDQDLRVIGAYPNPAVESSTLLFQVPAGYNGSLTVGIYDLTGRRVRTLDGDVSGGLNRMQWDGRENDGRKAASGIYFYQVTDGAGRASGRGRITLER